MRPLHRSLAVAALQCLLILSVAGKYAVDRERLPRAWAKSAPYDPNLPIRGRYVRMRLAVEMAPGTVGWWGKARLSAVDGRLVATPAQEGEYLSVNGRDSWALQQPVAYFLPEHVPDPSMREPGEELWVEVSVPREGPPRPIRLGIKKDGVLTPLKY